MKNLASQLCLIVFFVHSITYSQVNSSTSRNRSLVGSSWMVGLGFNFVDDGGDTFEGLFSLDAEWNTVSYPSRISVGKYFENGLGLEVIATVNKYKVGSLVQRKVLTEDIPYFGLDTRLSYDLNKIIGETGWFDPYLGVGLGYTDANNLGRGTFNATVGFRTWISDLWGLDINSSGKWSLDNVASNHLQHSIGVVYQFGLERTFRRRRR